MGFLFLILYGLGWLCLIALGLLLAGVMIARFFHAMLGMNTANEPQAEDELPDNPEKLSDWDNPNRFK